MPWMPQFWALVLHDEEWLRAEFDEITEPAEARISPPRAIACRRGSVILGRRSDRRAPDRGVEPTDSGTPDVPRATDGGDERSPPDEASPHQHTNRQLSRQGR